MSAAIQSLDVISYLANFKDEMAPNGYVHVDFKRDHMRLQYLEAEDKWMVTVIDLDSIVPAGHIRFRGSKYNPCVDPEKFVKLHNPNILITAEPSETIYSLGLSLLYAISTRFRIRVDKRKFDTEGLTERDGRMIVLDEDAFLKKILNARMTDEMNLVRVYLANKYRRIMAGKVDRDPEEMKELLDEYADMPEIIGAKKEAIRELREVNIDSTVHPNVFVGILECIKPYSERFGPEAMLKRFEYLWNEYLGSEKYSE